jgi:hypothetical protein
MVKQLDVNKMNAQFFLRFESWFSHGQIPAIKAAHQHQTALIGARFELGRHIGADTVKTGGVDGIELLRERPLATF